MPLFELNSSVARFKLTFAIVCVAEQSSSSSGEKSISPSSRNNVNTACPLKKLDDGGVVCWRRANCATQVDICTARCLPRHLTHAHTQTLGMS